MKKTILVSLAAVLFITACKKTKSTGHLWVNVNLSHALVRDSVPDSLNQVIAAGSLIKAGDGTNPINTAVDNSSNRSSKVLDFGEIKPGTYQVDSIHAYAYGDSAWIQLGAGDTTPVFTITADHDQTFTVTF